MEPLFRDSKSPQIEVINSKDNYIYTKEKKYLDFVMGWCIGNSGWNKKTINNIIKKFNGPTYVVPDYNYHRWDELAKSIRLLMPNKQMTSFRATGGTEAVEIALKMSKVYNKRNKFIAFNQAYHGQSLAALSLTNMNAKQFGPYSKNYIQISTDWEKSLNNTIKQIKTEKISAFISEPIICNLGVKIPPKYFFREIKKECEKTNTVFIMDEVATGFGRTGKMFGFNHYNLKPDIITLAKGISSGYAPLGATIATPEIAELMRFSFSNYSSYGWHPLAVEASIANLNYIKDNNLVEKSEKSGKYLFDQLSKFGNPEGKGLCIGFDTKNKNIQKDCLKDGLIVSTSDFGKNRITLFPSLDITKKEIDCAVNIIKKNY
jgi:acetylornithine/succinyldiaminopimelate/putrescine aminotransferase